MGAAVTSLIALAASLAGETCSQTFVDAVLLAHPQSRTEMAALREFAIAACRTDNPDVVWQIAYVESRLRFDIVAVNKDGETDQVLTGDKARDFLRTQAGTGRARRNADVGPLQINWRHHGAAYEGDPVRLLDPKEQVRYLVEVMAPTIVPTCGNQWVGCYHNMRSEARKERYLRDVEASGKTLREALARAVEIRSGLVMRDPARRSAFLARLQPASPASGGLSGSLPAALDGVERMPPAWLEAERQPHLLAPCGGGIGLACWPSKGGPEIRFPKLDMVTLTQVWMRDDAVANSKVGDRAAVVPEGGK